METIKVPQKKFQVAIETKITKILNVEASSLSEAVKYVDDNFNKLDKKDILENGYMEHCVKAYPIQQINGKIYKLKISS